MVDIKIGGYNFNQGIDRIITQSEDVSKKLPQTTSLPPAEEVGTDRLSAVLNKPGIRDVLDAELKPVIMDRGVLAPGAFKQAMRNAVSDLENLRETDPGNDKAYRAAIRVLNENQEIEGMLSTYMHALFKG
ncbi:hypothetical protein LPB41_01510 [Thalassospira sp. MA62]|nr:hypothetical protein [Thalassospira sp. MA62]